MGTKQRHRPRWCRVGVNVRPEAHRLPHSASVFTVKEFKEDLVSEKEGGQEPREVQQGQVVGEEHQDDVEREENAMVPRNAVRTD